ncbi:MAG TPA: ATP-binding protein [Longimicrobiales bacterium]
MIRSAETQHWVDANQRWLVREVARVRACVEAHARGERPPAPVASPATEDGLAPPALEQLVAGFGLSAFERDVLLLCAGPELEAEFAETLRAAGYVGPCFSLALAALPGAHWSALTPSAPLRYWRLVEFAGAGPLASSVLRIDERILHFLAGAGYADDRLDGLLTPVAAAEALPPSQRALADRIAAAWSRPTAAPPAIALRGEDRWGKVDVAAAAAAAVGLSLHVLRAADVPASASERTELSRLWTRMAILGRSALLIDAHDDASDGAARAVAAFADGLRVPYFLAAREPLPAGTKPVLSFDVPRPGPAEQRALWRAALAEVAPDDADGLPAGVLDRLVSQFGLGAREIRAAAARASAEPETAPLAARLWEACRAHARPRLDDLAQRIDPRAGWDELVLPAAEMELLKQIAAHARQRARVYEDWGFAAQGPRGLGITALFAGPSGTGKTLAAEVIAHDLELDLYRIDLSQVVSKYIGETEKNLRRVFDAAEEGGAVLLFDEADALFGKRSEVKDSHDRYANIEVSYLLQRMEAYRGLAILTTNLRRALDDAFLRRLRFIVTFPFPGAAERAEIWRRVFPRGTPTRGLDPLRLAQLDIAGGNIRNIALHAAFLAADAGEEVGMSHVLRAARSEYAKLERPLSAAEIGGWA